MGACPVTNEHPPKMVSPENFAKVSCGNVLGGSVEFDGQYLKGQLAVQDGRLIADIDLGKRREVSMGYAAVTDATPGVTPDGEEYAAVRTAFTYTPCAVFALGRAGRFVSLALDSIDIPTTDDPVKLTINGVEIDATSAPPVIDSVESKLAVAAAERDALKEKLASVEEKLAVATSPDAVAKAVKDHLDAETVKAKAAEKLAKVKAAFPKMSDLDTKSADVIDALYDLVPSDEDGLGKLRGTVATPATDARDEPPKARVSARDRMRQESFKAGRGAL
jgi:hypothetical protein